MATDPVAEIESIIAKWAPDWAITKETCNSIRSDLLPGILQFLGIHLTETEGVEMNARYDLDALAGRLEEIDE